MLDQQVATARRIAHERTHFGERNAVDGATFRPRAETAPALDPRNIDGYRFTHPMELPLIEEVAVLFDIRSEIQ